MKFLRWFLPLSLLVLACLQCRPLGPPPVASRERQLTSISSSGGSGKVPMSQIYRQVNLKNDMVPRGRHGRKVIRPMRPQYITIHSTQNYTADAWKHSKALKNGALRSPKTRYGNRIGYMIWHFTVDDKVAIQHMPTTEQGEHADFHGPGNRLSIGIEMCEHRGSDRRATIERTAKLTAILMKKNGIPLRNVVPHYHWPRRGKNPPNKNCPHFLLDNGRPGAKWRWFLSRVNDHYQHIE
ncbi:MAG: N-acetylmuramoyl-L-alanine amidase [Luteolibacter sp.]|nr:N-acetylmuramoyl-L-alanine amidase [Luteolibacter sp.]